MQERLFPDLQNGFMMLHYDGLNRWHTGIECVLARKTGDQAEEELAYLSHECRAERVEEDPYSHPGNYEYVAISTWAGNYALRSGPSIVGVHSADGRSTDRTVASYEKITMEISISCSDRTVRRVSFDDAKRMLQTDFQDGYVKLYMAISFRQSGDMYTLYAPCRYINFPHPTKAQRSYLQPISGYVLYEKDGRFHIAYVVSYIGDGKTRSVQFKVRDEISIGELMTHEFCKVERIDDDQMQCEFFAY